MIGFLFKSSIAFIVSFIILSFKVNNKPVFYYISDLTGPVGVEVQNSLTKSMKRSINKSKDLGKNLFKNADPKIINDQITSGQSSQNSSKKGMNHLILEDIRRDEVEKLDKLINKN